MFVIMISIDDRANIMEMK